METKKFDLELVLESESNEGETVRRQERVSLSRGEDFFFVETTTNENGELGNSGPELEFRRFVGENHINSREHVIQSARGIIGSFARAEDRKALSTRGLLVEAQLVEITEVRTPITRD